MPVAPYPAETLYYIVRVQCGSWAKKKKSACPSRTLNHLCFFFWTHIAWFSVNVYYSICRCCLNRNLIVIGGPSTNLLAVDIALTSPVAIEFSGRNFMFSGPQFNGQQVSFAGWSRWYYYYERERERERGREKQREREIKREQKRDRERVREKESKKKKEGEPVTFQPCRKCNKKQRSEIEWGIERDIEWEILCRWAMF